MKKSAFFLSLAIILCSLSSCEKENPPRRDAPIVSQFVYDGLSAYYYWNETMAAKKPTANDTDPVKYFNSVLYSTDIQHGWSWITDDVHELLAGFSGKSLSFGYDLVFIGAGENKAHAYVRYVYAGTPAAKAGMKRLDYIEKINGQPITTEQRGGKIYISNQSLDLLYGNDPVTFSTFRVDGDMVIPKEITIAPNGSDKDPVLCDSVYTINGKKVGYLFYTDFYDNFNHRLYEVFSRFKQEGVTDLVLDLRYNRGGAVSAAIYLASLIAPRAVVANNAPFVVMDYNDMLNTLFDRLYSTAEPKDKYGYDRKDYLGVYDAKYSNPLDANLDLKRVYVIATGDSYSASELTPFCLASHMDVILIGGDTGGKYTASWTVHAYDQLKDQEGHARANTLYDENDLSAAEKTELRNWAMQPIVAIYANKDGDNFSNPGFLAPAPDNKLEEGLGYISNWVPLGDTKDVFLGQALYLISGDESYRPSRPVAVNARHSAIGKEIVNPRNVAKPVIVDNIELTPEDFRKLRELQK
jgi:C-terminal processing protease CtpA/Prc